MIIVNILKIIVALIFILMIDFIIMMWLLAMIETESNEELTEKDKEDLLEEIKLMKKVDKKD